jgi:calcineurin-like phosphoesterase family protein
MDRAIVKRWNERVTPQDLVYHLDDFAFDDHDPYLELLNGQKHLILGNHDHSDRVKKAGKASAS